jgi:hypothetical protein
VETSTTNNREVAGGNRRGSAQKKQYTEELIKDTRSREEGCAEWEACQNTYKITACQTRDHWPVREVTIIIHVNGI